MASSSRAMTDIGGVDIVSLDNEQQPSSDFGQLRLSQGPGSVLPCVVGDPRGDANKKSPPIEGPLMIVSGLDQAAG